MRYRKLFFGFFTFSMILFFVLATPANASKEGGLSLYNVVLNSPGMDDSGPIHVEMQRTDKGIERLSISAFGRNDVAPIPLLQSIKEKEWINGILLSWSKVGLPAFVWVISDLWRC